MDTSFLEGKLTLTPAIRFAAALGLYLEETLKLLDFDKVLKADCDFEAGDIRRIIYEMAKAEKEHPTPKNAPLMFEDSCFWSKEANQKFDPEWVNSMEQLAKDVEKVKESPIEIKAINEMKVLCGLAKSPKPEKPKVLDAQPILRDLYGGKEEVRKSKAPTCEMTYDWMRLAGVCSEDEFPLDDYDAKQMQGLRTEIINELQELYPEMAVCWTESFCFPKLQIGGANTCIDDLGMFNIFQSLTVFLSDDEALRIIKNIVVGKIKTLFGEK